MVRLTGLDTGPILAHGLPIFALTIRANSYFVRHDGFRMKEFDFDRLEADLSDADEHVRLQAVQKIILYPSFEKREVPRFMKLLLKNLQDDSTAVRYYAKKAFARLKESLGSGELAIVLPSLLDEGADLSWENQPTFVYGTKEYWLYELSSVDFKIRVKAIIELSQKPSASIAERLFEMLGEERHEHVIATLVKYLAHFKDPRYFETVLPYLRHPDNRVRANTIEGLEIAGENEAAPHLVTLLSDPDNRVRANAAKFLMASHPDNVIKTIEDMLVSEHEWMRDSAIFLIRKAKPSNSESLLLRLMEDKEAEIRRKAALAMGDLDASAAATEALEELQKDSEESVRSAAKKTLASLQPRT